MKKYLLIPSVLLTLTMANYAQSGESTFVKAGTSKGVYEAFFVISNLETKDQMREAIDVVRKKLNPKYFNIKDTHERTFILRDDRKVTPKEINDLLQPLGYEIDPAFIKK